MLPAATDAEALAEGFGEQAGAYDARQQPGFWPLLRAGLVSGRKR